ncbi:MAG: hypothetical protein GH159_00310 [Dehalococcoidia bacterium]|nr:hypothetical protein [Dehalococcoidia bacterium]
MKKAQILAITLLAVLVLLVGRGAVACGGGNGDEEALPGNGEETAGQPHFTSADGRFEFVLNSLERTKEWPAVMFGDRVPEGGCDFVVIEVEVVRVEDGHISGSGEDSIVAADNGIDYQVTLAWQGAQLTDPEDLANSGVELVVGSTATIVAEIPEDAQPLSLRLTYLFFESWGESWEPLGDEERYIDIIFP